MYGKFENINYMLVTQDLDLILHTQFGKMVKVPGERNDKFSLVSLVRMVTLFEWQA